MFLNDKVFIVTGASSGIGEEISKQLSKHGSKVVCASRRKTELNRVTKLINESGGNSISVQTDITNLKECKSLVSVSIENFGKIDGLVLNAGISMWARFEDITDISFFKNLMDVNYHGAVNCVHAALPHLKESSGKIISCSTAQALMGFPSHSGYAASKHALHGFLSTIAIENKSEISILEAVLGWIRDTNLRGNAFGPNGKQNEKPPQKHTRESVGLENCVKKIIKAIEKENKTVYIPGKLVLIPILMAFCKSFLESKVDKAVRKAKQK